MASRMLGFIVMAAAVVVLQAALVRPALGSDTQTADGDINTLLGQAAGVSEFCSSADRRNRNQYRALLRRAVPQASSGDLRAARGTEAFQAAHAAARELLENIPQDAAVQACRAWKDL